MNKSLAAAVVALLALATPPGARADFLDWSASWSLGQGQGPSFVSGLSNVAVALSPTGPGSSTLSVGNFTTNSVTTEADSFNAPYDLSLKITDNTTHDSGTLTFHGLISGDTGPAAGGLTNSFSDPTKMLTLDGHTYKVSLDASTDLPDTTDGAVPLSARVSVSDGSGGGVTGPTGPPQTQQTPEPSGFILAALAAAGAAWRNTRGRRRERAR